MDLHKTQMKKSIHQARELRDSLEQDIWVKTSNGLPIHRQKTLQRIKDGELFYLAFNDAYTRQ